jgi:hypothetical protein
MGEQAMCFKKKRKKKKKKNKANDVCHLQPRIQSP